MAIRLSDQQVVEATGGERTRTGSRASYHEVCTDSRSVTEGSLFVALKGERFDAHDFLKSAVEKGAAGVIVEKGRAASLFADGVAVYEVENTLHALGRLARFHRDRFRLPIGAVTGSNGKTTTKELIASILETRGPSLKTQGNLNNEIGVPLTLFNLEPKHVAAIIEMGMNHAGEIARLAAITRPHAGLITSVQAAHLEGLGSLENIAKAKGELFWGLAPASTAIVNADDPRIVAQAQGLTTKVLTYGRAASAEVRLARVVSKGREGLVFELHWLGVKYPVKLQLIGEHNAMNAAGAFAMGLALGYSPEACVLGLENARPHSRRLQALEGLNHVTVIDDCYNANPSSMSAALATLKSMAGNGRSIAVIGDMLELGSEEDSAHQDLVREAVGTASRVAFFGPRTAKAMTIEGATFRSFLDIEPLNAWLKTELQPGYTVLVKGSRGMKLERVVAALTAGPAASCAEPKPAALPATPNPGAH